ncbi:MAG TPA: hypothetical protein VF765_15570 [Polyangiaceae bacterium]
MRTRFFACTACGRHVRAGDSRCPFCDANAPQARPLRTITERLTRAAMHAAGAAGAVVAISDCGSETRSTAFYGAPCIDGSCGVTVTDSGADAASDVNSGVFYGAPCVDGSCLPPEEAGSTDASGDAAEAGGDAAEAGADDGASGE